MTTAGASELVSGAEGRGARRAGASVWWWAVGFAVLAGVVRAAWVWVVRTVPVSDFAMYRESANYFSEFGSLDHGFIYMPGFVVLLAWIRDLGGDLLAQKIPGVVFGAMGASGLFLVAEGVFERRVAVVATAIYALWPAGVAMASVVGTDVPAAALIVTALGLLLTLGARRPWTAALVFGVVMGLAAWVRAVALPLTLLSAGVWLARGTRVGRTVALTGAALAATLLVLLPWGVRHLRQSGELYFTDDHGGITALIGANPNSEGTYTRALNQMFHDLTGRGVLDEPHRQTDQAAYALAREWARFEPAYALGLAVKKAERLFEPERRLLYWSIFRPGVLVGAPAAWFDARREGLGGAADAFGLVVAALALAGVALAVARRRWVALSLLPFLLALTATYTVFFAEPRYRVPIEMLAFPFAALTLVELAAFGVTLRRRSWSAVRRALPAAAAATVTVLVAGLAWPAALDAGAELRARHRWAATVWQVDGQARLMKWRPAGPLPARSPIDGAPEGVQLRSDGARPNRADGELGGGPLAPGAYALTFKLTAAGGPVQLRLVTAGGQTVLAQTVSPAPPSDVKLSIQHGGGPLGLTASVAGPAAATLWLGEGRLTRAGTPSAD